MKFMVIVHMKGDFDDELMALVESDTKYADTLKEQGILKEIHMQSDYRRCWCIYEVQDRDELEKIIRKFPLYDKLSYEIYELV